jgi:predicted nuclease with TOPRIM domain
MKSAAIRKEEPHCRADESEDVNMSEQLEVRVARIESDVQHIKEVTTDLRVELRRTNDKIDETRDTLEGKIDALDKKFDGKLDALKEKLHPVIVWALLLYFAFAGSLVGVLAKGFKWI